MARSAVFPALRFRPEFGITPGLSATLTLGLFPPCPSSDHNPEWRPSGDTFQKPFSQSQPGECSLQNRIAGHSSILIRVTRIALPLASGPNISASPSAKPDANCGNAPVMFGR
jgi:hypothetical protein